MVKRFKIKIVYTTSNDNTTEEDILNKLKIYTFGVFDTYKVLSVDEV